MNEAVSLQHGFEEGVNVFFFPLNFKAHHAVVKILNLASEVIFSGHSCTEPAEADMLDLTFH